MMRLAILVVALFAGLQSTVAVTTHVVGDTTGWVVPAEGPIFYAAWSAKQTFILGEILYFNFTTGAEDVARVMAEAFLTCNSTNPISLMKTGPANFSLNSTGEYYFIGTLDRSCFLGQKLAINVTTSPGPTSRTVPEKYTVGKSRKTSIVGDTPGAPASHIYATIPGLAMEGLGNPTPPRAGLPASVCNSSVWHNIAKELGNGIVSGIISQLIVSILLKCFEAMLKPSTASIPQQQPPPLSENRFQQPSSVPPANFSRSLQHPSYPAVSRTLSSIPSANPSSSPPANPSGIPPANPANQGITTENHAETVMTSKALDGGVDAVNHDDNHEEMAMTAKEINSKK